jgi:hypothetical protein
MNFLQFPILILGSKYEFRGGSLMLLSHNPMRDDGDRSSTLILFNLRRILAS